MVMWEAFPLSILLDLLDYWRPDQTLFRTAGQSTLARQGESLRRCCWLVGLASSYLVASCPLVGGAILESIAGHTAIESTLISLPIVAVLMGIETALVDSVFFRVLLKGSVRVQSGALLITNILIAIISLGLGLAWAFAHMPIFVAALDSCR
jgi:hypothetical protein